MNKIYVNYEIIEQLDTENNYPTYLVEWVKVNLEPREIVAGETNEDILKCKLFDNKSK